MGLPWLKASLGRHGIAHFRPNNQVRKVLLGP
jgi:hypothetical protein